jgi:hypothetical protein
MHASIALYCYAIARRKSHASTEDSIISKATGAVVSRDRKHD